MAIEIRKAERVKSKLRLGLAGPAGSGKTMSALKVAKGIGGPVCLIDTERGSGDKRGQHWKRRVSSVIYRLAGLSHSNKPEGFRIWGSPWH
jgi:hypothetical protein